MTTDPAVVRPRSALERFSLLGGAVYVVLFIVGSILAFGGAPDTSKNPAKVIAYWKVGSHRDKVNYGWLVVGIGLLFFVWFVAALRQRIRDADTGFLSNVVLLGGAIYATTTISAFAIEAGIKSMSDDTFQHTVYPELIHAADDAGWVLHASGAVGIASLIVATSVASMRLGRIGRGLGITSIVVGVLSLGLIAFFPTFLMLLWLLVTSIVVFVRGGRAENVPT
ncbi:MAG: hypothetical protein ACJ735_06835 [Actinomycetes bacterium]